VARAGANIPILTQFRFLSCFHRGLEARLVNRTVLSDVLDLVQVAASSEHRISFQSKGQEPSLGPRPSRPADVVVIVRPFLEQTDFARFFWLVDFFFLLLALPQTQLQAGLRPVQGSLVLLA
jgi:hypothetical protein